MDPPEPGLRERKKRRTRQLIAATARRLFAERGFEAVTVAEVARAADMSEATVFNYFPTKEDLFYSGLEAFEEELLATIRDRRPGESALAAFARFVLRPRGLLAATDPEAAEHLAAITRVIVESPALLAREQRIFAGYTDSLAALLAEETGAAPHAVAPWVAANALMGVHRALVHDSRRRLVAGERNPRLARAIRAQGRQAIAVLERGLGDYAIRDGGAQRGETR
ncbi:MAG TPA: TetR family transcriptional regulator [Solirubrobacteraceae bacterium]|nr:TetR family transcriptional regulator [Solirubrobacteraceae bacterium]HSD82037.1 TetR family transcriptional regulator [Solirubrobacteraceae bacterium]